MIGVAIRIAIEITGQSRDRFDNRDRYCNLCDCNCDPGHRCGSGRYRSAVPRIIAVASALPRLIRTVAFVAVALVAESLVTIALTVALLAATVAIAIGRSSLTAIAASQTIGIPFAEIVHIAIAHIAVIGADVWRFASESVCESALIGDLMLLGIDFCAVFLLLFVVFCVASLLELLSLADLFSLADLPFSIPSRRFLACVPLEFVGGGGMVWLIPSINRIPQSTPSRCL